MGDLESSSDYPTTCCVPQSTGVWLDHQPTIDGIVSDLSGVYDHGSVTTQVEAGHMNRNPRRTEQTRQDLIDAFWSLYCKKSIETISVKEVASTAGYNRGTFYEYFTDVYALLEHLELSLLPSSPEELPPRAAESARGTGQPLDRFIKMYELNQKNFVVLLGEHGDPAFQGRIKRHMRPLLQSVLAAQHGREGYEIEVIIEFVLSAMIGVLGYWFSCERKPPIEKLITLMYDLMGNGALHRLTA